MDDWEARYAREELEHDRAAFLKRISIGEPGEASWVSLKFAGDGEGSKRLGFSRESGAGWRCAGETGAGRVRSPSDPPPSTLLSDGEMAEIAAAHARSERFLCIHVDGVPLYERCLWLGKRVGEMLALSRRIDEREPAAEDCLDTLDFLLPHLVRRLEAMARHQILFSTSEGIFRIDEIAERLTVLEGRLRSKRDGDTEFYLRVVAPEQCRRLHR